MTSQPSSLSWERDSHSIRSSHVFTPSQITLNLMASIRSTSSPSAGEDGPAVICSRLLLRVIMLLLLLVIPASNSKSMLSASPLKSSSTVCRNRCFSCQLRETLKDIMRLALSSLQSRQDSLLQRQKATWMWSMASFLALTCLFQWTKLLLTRLWRRSSSSSRLTKTIVTCNKL